MKNAETLVAVHTHTHTHTHTGNFKKDKKHREFKAMCIKVDLI